MHVDIIRLAGGRDVEGNCGRHTRGLEWIRMAQDMGLKEEDYTEDQGVDGKKF